MLVRNGASVAAVRDLAGHSKIEVTQRYVHANDRDLTAAIAMLPSMAHGLAN
jgi:site-specific recombinase XerD